MKPQAAEPNGQAKEITVIVAGNENPYDLAIEPGATPRDVFETLSKTHGIDLDPGAFRLKSDRLGTYFGPNESIYPRVQKGEKLYANKSMDVALI